MGGSEEKLLCTVRAMINRMESLTDDLNDMQGKMSSIESRITGQVGIAKVEVVPPLNPPPAPSATVAGGVAPDSPACSQMRSPGGPPSPTSCDKGNNPTAAGSDGS